jgi:hypothetical protein
MISGQRLSWHAAGITNYATSWPLDLCIGMTLSTGMIMMTTWRNPERHAVDRAILVMAMTMVTARVRRTCTALRTGPGKGREQRRGRLRRRVRRRKTVNGKVLINEPEGEMISLVLLLWSPRSKCQRQT